jgi:hypothetical protein
VRRVLIGGTEQFPTCEERLMHYALDEGETDQRTGPLVVLFEDFHQAWLNNFISIKATTWTGRV